jgi:hypothetical protein
MAVQFTTSYLEDSLALLRRYKTLAERALKQVPDDQLFTVLDDETNSLAMIVQHIAGNLRSRWTDVLTTDGEKPDRDRDREFENVPASRAELMASWEEGWRCLLTALESFTDADLTRSVTIRAERHSVMQAIGRAIIHYSYHCGQIVFLAKHLQHGNWKSLSIPRGGSAEYNQRAASDKIIPRG